MKANMINEITSSRRNVAGGVIFASHAMIRVIFTVVLITCLFRSTVADQLHQDRKQREEIIPKLSNQYYLKNVTSDKNNEQEFMLAPTSKTVAGGRPQVGDEQLFITSTSSVSSTTNVVTSPTSTASIESTSPSFSQTTSLSPRKQEDAKQLLIHQTASNSSSSKSSQQLHQNHARQHRISPNERDHINESRQQSKHANDDPFYQASTSQSVTIAEPEMAASSNQEQQMQQRQKVSSRKQAQNCANFQFSPLPYNSSTGFPSMARKYYITLLWFLTTIGMKSLSRSYFHLATYHNRHDNSFFCLWLCILQ